MFSLEPLLLGIISVFRLIERSAVFFYRASVLGLIRAIRFCQWIARVVFEAISLSLRLARQAIFGIQFGLSISIHFLIFVAVWLGLITLPVITYLALGISDFPELFARPFYEYLGIIALMLFTITLSFGALTAAFLLKFQTPEDSVEPKDSPFIDRLVRITSHYLSWGLIVFAITYTVIIRVEYFYGSLSLFEIDWSTMLENIFVDIWKGTSEVQIRDPDALTVTDHQKKLGHSDIHFYQSLMLVGFVVLSVGLILYSYYGIFQAFLGYTWGLFEVAPGLFVIALIILFIFITYQFQ